jgi:hypothetical protein
MVKDLKELGVFMDVVKIIVAAEMIFQGRNEKCAKRLVV